MRQRNPGSAGAYGERARRTVASLSLLALALMAGVATAAATSMPLKERAATVQGKQATILTTAGGKVLYYFSKDTAKAVACSGMCTGLWSPLLLPSGKPTGPATIAKDLSVLNGANGRQVEYRGHPLYTYGNDQSPGQMNGEGVAGEWFVAVKSLKPNG